MITILVGEEEHPFTVHKDMLCAKSKFFKAACSKVWASGREKIVRQPEGMPGDFQIYVEWVYNSKISLDTDDVNKQQNTLMDLYILGDVLDDYQLRNATLKRLIANTQNGLRLNSEQLHKVYEFTMAGSPLRKFLVHWVLMTFEHDDIKAHIARNPAEFVQELAVVAVEQVESVEVEEAFEVLMEMFEPETDSG